MLEHFAHVSSRIAFRVACFACRKTGKKRRSEMSGGPVEHYAAWLLSYDQALTAENHKICLAAPDMETQQFAGKVVKQMPGGLDLLCCDRWGERDFDRFLRKCCKRMDTLLWLCMA